MITNNLEESLRKYCENQDSVLFEESIYFPMKFLAASICSKYKIKSRDIEEAVSDMVSHASVVLPEKFDKNKGKAKSMLYIVMSQYLIDKLRREQRSKRDINQLVFIEDLEQKDKAILIEISIDNLEELRETLLYNQQLFDTLGDKLQKRIKDKIIECIQFPEKYESNYGSYTKDIAKKCKTTINKVYQTIKAMNLLYIESLNYET